MTEGEYRVGMDFNPSANPQVTNLKGKAAGFIDACLAAMPSDPTTEAYALLSRAARECEAAAMWAVKGVTKRPRE